MDCVYGVEYDSKPSYNYRGSEHDFFEGMENNYKIAYQTKSFSTSKNISHKTLGQITTIPDKSFERIDIIVSNFNGTDKKNITELINLGENIAFVLPRWSPDGEKLAFTSIKYKKENGERNYSVYTDIFITDKNNSNPQKLYSYKSNNINISFRTLLFSWNGVRWSKDSKRMIVYKDETSQRMKDRGYGGTPILLSLDPKIPPQEFLGDNYDDFEVIDLNVSISPDEKYELIKASEKEIPLLPGGPGFDLDLRPKVRIGHDALYLKNRSFGMGKVKIYDGYIDVFFWTRDSKYTILYSRWSQADQFLIINLKGQSITMKGANPDIQYSHHGTASKK